MNLAICGELDTDRTHLRAVAASVGGAQIVEFEPDIVEGGWPERFAGALTAIEKLFAASDPAVVLVAGSGPVALAASLTATRADLRLVRVGAGERDGDPFAARDAALADRLADLLVCFSEADREALAAEGLASAAVLVETPDQAGAAIHGLVGARSAPAAPL